jgi:hypothetical protein
MDGPLATIAVAVIGSTPGMLVKRWLAALHDAIPTVAAPMRTREP